MSGEASTRSIWRNRSFLLFSAGQLTSSLGSGLLTLAVLLHVYASTHSTRATTFAFVCETVPLVLLSPVAGGFADRHDRRWVLIGTDCARAALLLPLLLSTRLSVLLPVLAVQAALGAVFRPAYSAFVPALVPAAQLASANGFTQSSMAVLSLTAPPAGGALYAAFGFPLIVTVDIVSFAASVITLASLRISSPDRTVARRSSLRAHLADGTRALAQLPVMQLMLATGLCAALFEACLGPVFVPYLQGVLHATPTEVGLATGAQGAGTLAAGAFVGVLTRRFGAGQLFAAGIAGVAAAAVAFALAPNLAAALAILAVLGVPAIFINVSSTTLLQTLVPDDLLGRAFGLFSSATAAATVVGAFAPALLADIVGLRVMLLGASGMLVVATAVAVAGVRRLNMLQADALAQQQLHREPLVGVGQVDVGEGTGALDPVSKSVDVDGERVGGTLGVLVAAQPHRQGAGELAAVSAIVVEQSPDRFRGDQ